MLIANDLQIKALSALSTARSWEVVYLFQKLSLKLWFQADTGDVYIQRDQPW